MLNGEKSKCDEEILIFGSQIKELENECDKIINYQLNKYQIQKNDSLESMRDEIQENINKKFQEEVNRFQYEIAQEENKMKENLNKQIESLNEFGFSTLEKFINFEKGLNKFNEI